VGEIFILTTEPIAYEINASRDMPYINYLMRQDAIAPSSVHGIEIVTQDYIL